MEDKKPDIVPLMALTLAPPPGSAPRLKLPSVLSLDLGPPRNFMAFSKPVSMPKPLPPKKSDSWIRNLSNSRKFYSRTKSVTADETINILEELSSLTVEEIIEQETKTWTRTCPADLYYERDTKNFRVMHATQKLMDLCERFNLESIVPGMEARLAWPQREDERSKGKPCPKSCKGGRVHQHSSDEEHSDFEEGEVTEDRDRVTHELNKKRSHPFRTHPELWHNEEGETNEGPVCKCSLKSRRIGIRHGIYVGETTIPKCDPFSNNVDRLYQYRVTLSPPTNFLVKYPTIITHDAHEFIFEGFSVLSHTPIPKLPTCKVIRFNIEYTIIYIEEKLPENYTVRELDLFTEFIFKEVLELYDFDLFGPHTRDGCPQFHILPRFVRDIADNGKEILSMNEVLSYLLKSRGLLVDRENLGTLLRMSRDEWQRYAEEIKEMIATKPGARPSSVRVDQLDRDQLEPGKITFPAIVHFGIRPPQLSYAGSPQYQRAWREYVKYRHLLANMTKPSQKDKERLLELESRLSAIRTTSSMKRDVTVAVSAEGYHKTGIMTDIVQHALLLPVLISHFRLHRSMDFLEKSIDYTFSNRSLLQLALTHPSYRENFGTNPDHARNSLTNCGIRQPEYGDRKIHYQNMRKRGINTLINIMARFGKREATESRVTHNERLEFLGDAVVEFITSIHLFFMFPDVEEGGLATYRAAIVQNQHLAVLARKMKLDHFMLYAHGSDLCHELELRHAMANCFEALMGALFLDGGWEVADKVFGKVLYMNEPRLHNVWIGLPPHPLQEQEPNGDRQWIADYPVLQKLTEFEETTGIRFKHIRLLARSFTDRSIGMNNLTLGSNQRMEFLGDTVLQLIASEYLYKHFPDHHEGHLSLLRSSLVNNRTQAVVCDDLGMTKYAEFKKPKNELKIKDKADLLEAFLGAVYVDRGLTHCIVFCNVCFFPRLQSFILNQEWNDPKSKLQQCCLTLRAIGGGEPDIPQYKVIQARGPTNTRIYTVAVYFRGRRLSKASGFSIQSAEMQAATLALENCEELFPQLQYQKKVMSRSIRVQKIDKDKVLAEYDTERVRYKGFVEKDDPDSDPELPRILHDDEPESDAEIPAGSDSGGEGLEEAVKILKDSAKEFESKLNLKKPPSSLKMVERSKVHFEDWREPEERKRQRPDDRKRRRPDSDEEFNNREVRQPRIPESSRIPVSESSRIPVPESSRVEKSKKDERREIKDEKTSETTREKSPEKSKEREHKKKKHQKHKKIKPDSDVSDLDTENLAALLEEAKSLGMENELTTLLEQELQPPLPLLPHEEMAAPTPPELPYDEEVRVEVLGSESIVLPCIDEIEKIFAADEKAARKEKKKKKKEKKIERRRKREAAVALDPISDAEDEVIFVEEKNLFDKEVTEIQISDEEIETSNVLLTNYIPGPVPPERLILPPLALSRLVQYSDSDKDLSEISDSEMEPIIVPKPDPEGEAPVPEIPSYGLLPEPVPELVETKIEVKEELKVEVKDDDNFSDLSDGNFPDVEDVSEDSSDGEISEAEIPEVSASKVDEHAADSLSEGEILD